MKQNVKRLAICLPEPLYERLREEAFINRMPMAQIIRDSLQSFLSLRNKKEVNKDEN